MRNLTATTRKHLSSKDFEYIKVEKIGLNQDKYFLNVSYRSRHASIGGDKGSFRLIKIDMNSLYKAIVADPELAVAHVKINAQLEMQDKYGNTAWIDVYRTQVTEDVIGKLNKENLRLVDFEKVWDVVHIHSIFWPYK